MTEKGTLTDFEGSTVRINDIPMPAKPNVMQACRSVLKKKMEVDFTVEQIDGILTVTNIAPHQDKAAHEKAKAMGFGEPTPGPAPAAKQEEKKDCTSSGTPADAGLKPDVRSGPKKIDGEIININPEKRNLALRSLDEKGYEITTLFVWRENRDLDQAAIKQKPGWYVTVTYETQGEINHAQDIKYCDRPASMKKKTGYSGGSGKPYTPRNEKPMIYESAFKSCVDLVRDTDFAGMDYAARVEAVRVEADKVARWIAKEGGA
jgi:hypothetical protein